MSTAADQVRNIGRSSTRGNGHAAAGVQLRRLGSASVPLLAAGVVCLVWQLVVDAGWAPSSIAAPTQVWNEFAEDPGGLWFHIQPTLSGAVTGFAYATVLAFLVSMLTIVIPATSPVVYNASVITYSVPLIALAPVLLVWIGNGPGLRTTIAAIAGFFPVVVGCMQGFRSIDPSRDELLAQLSATRPQRFRHLVLPEALPYIFAGLKVAAASAVLGAIISEWSGANRGLGLAMIAALSGYNPPGVWLTIVASTVLTLSLYNLVGLVERFSIRWEFDRDAVSARS